METQNYYWWREEQDRLANSVQGYVKFLNTDQAYKQAENFRYMRLYGNYDFNGLRMFDFVRTEAANNSIQNKVTLNIVQSMIDTVVSKITKNRPKPMFITEGGDFSQQRRAKKLSQFIEGQFDASDFY
jgi:hypothetical protein